MKLVDSITAKINDVSAWLETKGKGTPQGAVVAALCVGVVVVGIVAVPAFAFLWLTNLQPSTLLALILLAILVKW